MNAKTESLMKKKESDEDMVCALCEHGTPLFTGDTVICRKRGLVWATACCRRFRYDPLKRDVRPLPPVPKLDFFELP